MKKCSETTPKNTSTNKKKTSYKTLGFIPYIPYNKKQKRSHLHAKKGKKERRRQDLNLRVLSTIDFESNSLDHSDTPPLSELREI